jgi:PBP1b-binding outer membrane lipoprotein LpoB
MMKKIFSAIAVIIILASCSFLNPYGKKVKINDSLEVYIKGDSTTEEDAKKLGNYLAETWKDLTNKKSFQLIKENGGYTVKMVVDEEKVKNDSTLDLSFTALKMLIETQVFNGSKVKLVLTNNKFKDIKTFDDTNSTSTEAATKDSTSADSLLPKK